MLVEIAAQGKREEERNGLLLTNIFRGEEEPARSLTRVKSFF